MKGRILKVRKDNKCTQDEFAERLNLSKNYIWQIEKGERNPSSRTIVDICREFNVNEEWLRTGEGEQYIFPIKDDYDEITTIIGSRDLKARKAIIDYWNLSDSDKELFWKFIERFIDNGEN